MNATLIAFLGAGIGGALRHGVNTAGLRLFGSNFPYGTITVNIVGSFLMGLIAGWFAFRSGGGASQPLRLFLTTGVLGGFTTFSAFSLDVALLWERGAATLAALYVAGSVALAGGALRGARPDAVAAMTAAPAKTQAGEKAQTLAVTADEDGMRLDRWFKRRVPSLSLSHLNKIVRKGQVRVDGKRVETSTRLATASGPRAAARFDAPASACGQAHRPGEADAQGARATDPLSRTTTCSS